MLECVVVMGQLNGSENGIKVSMLLKVRYPLEPMESP